VLLADGAGGFGIAQPYPYSSPMNDTGAAAAGDINDDGRDDIAVILEGTGECYVYLADAVGMMTHVSTVGALKRYPKLGDLDADGMADLVLSAGASIEVRLSNGDGSFADAVTLSASGSQTAPVIIGDFNNDGHADILSGDADGTLFLGNGDGTFDSGTTTHAGFATDTAADFNNDGRLDICGASNTLVQALLQETSSEQTRGFRTITPISGIDLSTEESARAALGLLTSYSEQVELVAGAVGASMLRLEVSAANLTAAVENLRRSAASILDVDVAEETARLVSGLVKRDAAAAMLAQANQQPAMALRLLGAGG